MNNTKSVIRQATDVWKDVYHLRQSSTEAVEIKDDDRSDDEPDNVPSIMVTEGELHALAKEEEEDKEEEDKEEEKDEDTVRIATEVIASLPHTP